MHARFQNSCYGVVHKHLCIATHQLSLKLGVVSIWYLMHAKVAPNPKHYVLRYRWVINSMSMLTIFQRRARCVTIDCFIEFAPWPYGISCMEQSATQGTACSAHTAA